LPTDKQTDQPTNKPKQKHKVLGRGNNHLNHARDCHNYELYWPYNGGKAGLPTAQLNIILIVLFTRAIGAKLVSNVGD